MPLKVPLPIAESYQRSTFGRASHCADNCYTILSAAKRAANLTQSLLTFSRKQIMSPVPVNLSEIIERFEKFLIRVIGEDIEFRIYLSTEDLIVMADSSQIEQVLMNLATKIYRLNENVPVLFTSVYIADIIDKKGAHEQELNFIAKPVTPSLLLSKVREILDN